MIMHLDHVTVVVRDVDKAKDFFALLGFVEGKSVVISGDMFAVKDLDAEVKRLTSHGVVLRNEIMTFHSRRLVFLSGPEGITIELAEWHA